MNSAPNKYQIVKIHALKGNLGWDDEEYRTFLSKNFEGRTSCKQLSYNEAVTVIGLLETFAVLSGVRDKKKRKYDDLAERGAVMATPKQLRYIDVLWAKVSRAQDAAAREAALNKLILNKFNVGKLEWLKRSDTQKVIKLLLSMQRTKRIDPSENVEESIPENDNQTQVIQAENFSAEEDLPF